MRVDFDRRLKLNFHGSKITSDAGLLAYRELDEAIGLTDFGGAALSDLRRGKNTRHLLTGLLRQSVYGRLAGYEDVNDAERLLRDPAMRAIVDRKGLDRRAASTSQMGRFETEWLATNENLVVLTDLSGVWIDRVHDRKTPKIIILDMDSSESPTYGDQEGSAYNGHFGCTCYHPLFCFNQFGDLERCALRTGNGHSADGWREVLEPVMARYRNRKMRRYFRGDAAFAKPEIYEFLEAEGYAYTIRLPTNPILQESISHLLSHPVGRPPNHVRRYYASFSYQVTQAMLPLRNLRDFLGSVWKSRNVPSPIKEPGRCLAWSSGVRSAALAPDGGGHCEIKSVTCRFVKCNTLRKLIFVFLNLQMRL